MIDNPYGADLGSRDPVQSLAETPARIDALVRGFSSADFERTYAPGKWTARQILVHLTQTELMIEPRIRLALTAKGYTVQPFEQDDLLALEPGGSAIVALDAYLAVRRFSLPLFTSLTPAQLAVRCGHPQHGEIDLRWILVMLAGHELRHLGQLQSLRAAPGV